MIRVVVTGSECTGKTTLATELAQHYGTAWVTEFVRQFVEAKGESYILKRPTAGERILEIY